MACSHPGLAVPTPFRRIPALLLLAAVLLGAGPGARERRRGGRAGGAERGLHGLP